MKYKKSLIEEGAKADLTLIDIEKRMIIDENFFESKSHNSPYIGQQLQGFPVFVIKDGNIKLAEDHIID